MIQIIREWAGIWLVVLFGIGVLYAIKSLIHDIRRNR